MTQTNESVEKGQQNGSLTGKSFSGYERGTSKEKRP